MPIPLDGFFGCREIAGGLEQNHQEAETLRARVRAGDKVLLPTRGVGDGLGSGMPVGEAAIHPRCDLEYKENISCCEQSVLSPMLSLSFVHLSLNLCLLRI